MKKRLLSLLLCAIMVVGTLPLSPLAEYTSIRATAANIETLQSVYNSVPDQSTWDQYVDTGALKVAYEYAALLLDKHENFEQSEIDACTQSLREAIAGLKYHTMGIALNKTTHTASVGDNFTLKAILQPADAADEVTWKSSDAAVASVTQKGVVTVNKYSSKTITITATSNGHSASCALTVLNPLGGVKLSKTSATLYEGKTLTLSATAYGVDQNNIPTGNVIYTWSSDDLSVAKVTDQGVVTAVSKGSCNISVTATDNSNVYTAKCKITVNELINVSSLQPITITTSGSLVMTVKETLTFRVTVLPSNASVKDLTWQSSDSTVASVSKAAVTDSGVASVEITARKEGKTKITYKTTDGSNLSGSFYVEVRPLITALALSPASKVITLDSVGEKFTAVITPENAGNQVLSWSSDNPLVCEVDYNGTLVPHSAGTCNISAATSDGSNIVVSGKLRVAAKASSVTISRNSLTLNTGKTYTLAASVTTLDGEVYDDVKWASSNSSVATVNQNGVVTAKYPGQAVITATALDSSGKNAVCVVTVNQPVTGVTLPATKAVYVGSSATLTPTFKPTYATNQNVTWKSSNTSVATVTSAGKVTGKSAGKATITCTTEDGGFTASCTVTVMIKTEGVTLNYTSAKLWKGNTLQLVPTITPADATNKNVTWTSSNTKVANVSSTGLVTAVAGGKATITVKTNNSGKTATCTVTVLENCTGVKLEADTMKLYIGQNYSMKASVLPSTATNKEVIWSSDDKTVVKVSSTGLLTAVKEGSATITVKTVNGGFTDTCLVTVTRKVPVTGVTLDKKSLDLHVNKYYTFLATVKPSNASEKGLVWSTSNSRIVAVNQSGLIKAKATGTAIITATTVDGSYQAQCKVNVIQPVTGVRISSTSVTIAVGKSKVLTANVFPEDATNQKVTWKSSDIKVATVDSKGLVTAKAAGTAAISVTTADGGYTSTCNFNVVVPVTGVKIGATALKIPKGETRLLTASVYPSNATNKGITWSSSNNAIATVNEAGQITAKSKGTVNIKAVSKDGGYSATCVVEVLQLASSVKLNYTSITLDVGKYKTFTATITPSTVSYPSVVWKTSNRNVVAISSKGLIKGVSAGTATITCTTKDGNAKTTCKVTVVQPATGIKLDPVALTVREGSVKAITATVLPSDTTNSKVTWSSANTKIATVDSNGVVKGIAPGYVKITAKTVSGGQTATCTVRVIRSVTGIRLNKTDLTINVGKRSVITPTVLPYDASIKTVKWTSSNYDVADVLNTGEVVAKAPGYAVITATTKDRSFKASCNVLVIQPVTGVSLNKTSLLVEAGEKYSLSATVKPSNASDKSLKWTSSNTAVAKVSTTGVVTGVKSGTATITCTTVSGGLKATCKVQVVKKVTGISISKTSATLYLGKTLDLNATVKPSDATVKTVSWYSGDKTIATVDKTGLVTPVKPGTVTIGVRTIDGNFKAYCRITVKRAVESIKLNKSTLTIYTGKYFTFTPTILPTNATDKSLVWTTSNSKVLAVSQKGLIKGKAEGKAIITATTENGLKYSCTVTVRQSAESVALNYDAANVYAGEILNLTATVLPGNTYNKSVKWTSSNDAVAKVSSTGVVTGVKAGKATITVTTVDGSFTAKCDVTVLQHVTSITFEESALSMRKGDEKDLVVKIYPANATDKTYTFKSSDPEVVFVSATGHIIAKMGGEAVITVTSTENNKKATCRITVIEPVTAVALDKEESTIFVGDKLTLSVVVSPTDANNKSVMWTSSDPSVATISSTGVVTALKSGKTTITVKTNDGGFTDSCEITCLQKPLSVKIDSSVLTVNTGEQATLVATVLPEDSFNKEITWHSSNENVATVDEKGVVTAINPGQTVITVKTVEGEKEASCKLTVHQPVQKIELDRTEITINKNFTQQLNAVIYPSNASNQNVTWSSSDITVATVVNGLVKAESKGTAYITVKAEDTGMTAICKVTVRQQPEEITFSKNEFTVCTGEKEALEWTVLPENSNDKSVSFESENEELFTVDENGVITGIKAGTAAVIVKANDGTAQGSVNVRVIQKAEEVIVSEEIPVLWVGESFTLSAQVLPDDTTDKSVVWTSDDEDVAVVDENGVITAIGAGVCEITAESVYGTAADTVTVEVRQQVTGIEISRTEKAMNLDDTFTLTAKVLPENAYDKSVTWVSSDNETVSVDENGLLTAKKTGTATITAISSDESIKAECAVRVIRLIDSITINEAPVVMEKGDTKQLTVLILPENATEKQLTWSSDNEEVVSVDENGLITGVAGGKAKITVTTTTDGVYAECEVTVDVKSTGIKLNKNAAEVYCGDTLSLEAVFTPEDTTNKNIIWSTDDDTVATVEDGVVTPHKVGTVTVTATAEDTSVSDSCVITVKKHVESVNVIAEDFTLEKGGKITLETVVLPEDSTNKKLIWSSADEKIAKFTDGVLEAVGVGTVTVTAESEDGGIKDTCEITVIQKPEKIIFSEAAITLVEGENKALTVSYEPADTTEKDVEWKSADEDIAQIDENGVVTAVSKGETKISAISKADGNVVGKCTVTVTRAVKGIEIEGRRRTEYIGRPFTLDVIFTPADATNQNLIWQTSDKTVATVENGKVTPVGTGSAVISAESEDGGYIAYSLVTVLRGIDSVAFEETEISLNKKETHEIKVIILPDDASVKNLIWTSDNEKTATVKNGVITAGEIAGTAIIRGTAPDNENAYAECKVTVIENVTSITLDETELQMRTGDEKTLNATVMPTNATDRSVIWRSTDSKVATVDENGVVKAVMPGTAKIICTTVDKGLTAICDVKVMREIESFSISIPAISMKKGSSLPLTITANPENHDESFSFASLNEDVITVGADGVVFAKGPGKATVIAVSNISGTRAECEITVIQSVESIEFASDVFTDAYTGLSHSLSYTVAPENASDKSVRWLSSDESIATVNEAGLITYHSAGEVVITVQSIESEVYAQCTVTVKQAPEEVYLNAGSAEMSVGQTLELKATIGPENSFDKTVYWKADSKDVVYVDAYGRVTALAKGTAIVTVTTWNGHEASCMIEVK